MSEGAKRRVLLPVTCGFSPDLLKALVVGRLGLLDVEVTLLKVLRIPLTSPLEENEFFEEIVEAEKELKHKADELRKAGMKVEVRVVLARNLVTGIEECLPGHDILILPSGSFGGTLRKVLARISIEGLAAKFRTPVVVVSKELLGC
ncbi:MAG: hypothetical protein NZ992_05320 [Candidatus Korarchaeum sp.]|nr:hypothetical protein [Candidatus Korarchaeum sp.]MDW8036195.1 hypothetical protein [Candidatus Korarchaeum sp.]